MYECITYIATIRDKRLKKPRLENSKELNNFTYDFTLSLTEAHGHLLQAYTFVNKKAELQMHGLL